MGNPHGRQLQVRTRGVFEILPNLGLLLDVPAKGGTEMTPTWISRFFREAWEKASWSKDSTKVGAIAVDDDRVILESGYNGIPRRVQDLPERMERPTKYLWTSHAEENLVANAARAKLKGSTVFVTHLCCNACARMLINAGVSAVQMFKEAGVKLVFEGKEVV